MDNRVDKHVNKPVDKAVYNLEDKRVEQIERTEESMDWTARYARYFMHNLSANTEFTTEQQRRIHLLLQTLLEASLNGDSMLPCEQTQINDLSPMVLDATEVCDPVAPCIYQAGTVALYRYWALEQRLSLQVMRLSRQEVPVVDATKAYALLNDPHQRQALDAVSQHALTLITGGPGTGKTYTLSRIIALLQHSLPHVRIAMAAPTGKAAQRMQEALQLALNSPELKATGWISPALAQQRTQTLHRLLGMGLQQKPRFHAKQPLPFDVIVVDEASMLDLNLATALFEAVAPHARLILLGDAQQLASVDVGAVLADLQACPALARHRVHLHNSRRFHAQAAIGRCATFIQNQAAQVTLQMFYDAVSAPVACSAMQTDVIDQHDLVQCCELPINQHLAHLSANREALQASYARYYAQLMQGFLPYVSALKGYLAYLAAHAASSNSSMAEEHQHVLAVVDAFDRYRLLAGVKHGAWGIQQLNRVAAQWLQQQLVLSESREIYTGRAVMMTYNDYALGLSNGDIGICLPRLARNRSHSPTVLQPAQMRFEVYFPSLNQWFSAERLPKTLQDAYALTIHKSQGSEFEHCAVLISDDAAKVLSRELLYTAISRAKRVVSLWLHPEALLQALQQDSSRHSGLLHKLNRVMSL